jgi:hypothetical protein
MNVRKRQRSPVGPSSGQPGDLHDIPPKATVVAAKPSFCCETVDRGMTIETALGVLENMALCLKASASAADNYAWEIAYAKDLQGNHASDEACWYRLSKKARFNEARPTPLSVLKDLPCQAYHNKAAFAAWVALDTARYVERKVISMCFQPRRKIELEDASEVMEALAYVWQWAVIAGTAPECQSVVDKAAATWDVARVVWAWVREQRDEDPQGPIAIKDPQASWKDPQASEEGEEKGEEGEGKDTQASEDPRAKKSYRLTFAGPNFRNLYYEREDSCAPPRSSARTE